MPPPPLFGNMPRQKIRSIRGNSIKLRRHDDPDGVAIPIAIDNLESRADAEILAASSKKISKASRDAITAYRKHGKTQRETEVLGEIAALRAMTKPKGIGEGYQAFQPIAPGHGAGIDQAWVKKSARSISDVMIVEAKGPGAKLSSNPFQNSGNAQMSPNWLLKKIPKIKGYKKLVGAKFSGRVITARELGGKLSHTTTQPFDYGTLRQRANNALFFE